MSILVSILIGFAFYTLFKSIWGNGESIDYSVKNKDEDIARLREIADYDRWEEAGRKDS